MLTGQILLQLIVILLIARGLGLLCRLIGQSWVIGEILAGLILGPTLLEALFPAVKKALFPANTLPTLQTLGDIGLILYMFSLGVSIDTHTLISQGRKALVVSLSSILLPLVMGATLAFALYPGFAGAKTDLFSFMLLVATTMAITAFPVLARLLSERKMLDMPIGTLALTCAAINDVVAWCLLALVLAIIQTKILALATLTIVFTGCFVAGMLLVVRPLLLLADRHLPKPLLIVLSTILLLLSAYTTNAIGIHPVFGAFLMGIILPRRAIFIEQVRSIERVNGLLFLPLYFVYSGLRTRVGLINSPNLWLICLLVFTVACLGKLFGGMLSFRIVGGTWKESFALGVLMNTRGLVELIVLNIGLDAGIFSPTLFAMLVLMAIGTTMMVPPLLPLSGYHQQSLHTHIPNRTSEVEEQLVEN